MLTFSRLGRYGRFANQLFQIAGTIGLATKHGYSFAFPEWKNYDHAERFGSTEDIDLQKYFVNPLPQVDASGFKDYPVSWGWHPDLEVADNVSLSGHFQSEKYFKHCIHLVRHYFRMKQEKVGQVLSSGIVAIHVRRGDYDNLYHPLLGKDYYDKAVSIFPKDSIFFVFSDDVNAAKKIVGINSRNYVFVDDAGYIEDFAVMKQCNHFICANSSFSLMAAILGEAPDKMIVCPRNWFGPAWGISMETKDIYPENSIVI